MVGKTHQRKTQKEPKTEDVQRANINHSTRSVSSGGQGDCTTESHGYSTTDVYTINPGGQKQRLTGRVSQIMGRQINNPTVVRPLWKTVWNFLRKQIMELPFDPAISLLGLFPKNPKTPIQKNLCTPVFTAAQFTIASTGSNLSAH